MTLDASVVARWFDGGEDGGSRRAVETGTVQPTVPPLFFLEMLNVAGRHWGYAESVLHRLLADLDRLAFTVEEPNIDLVATWVAKGLTSYDASYVALAEQRAETLVTFDKGILKRAPEIAHTPGQVLGKT